MASAAGGDFDPPTISVVIRIDPPSLAPDGEQHPWTITLTATLHASSPITIFTWPGVFNLQLSLRRANFYCRDLTTDSAVFVEESKGPKRPGFRMDQGSPDEAYFQTLEPEVARTFTSKFGVPYRTSAGLVPGHRYRFGIREGEKIYWWQYGTKDEVMTPAGRPLQLGRGSDPTIIIAAVPVEFEMV